MLSCICGADQMRENTQRNHILFDKAQSLLQYATKFPQLNSCREAHKDEVDCDFLHVMQVNLKI